VKAELDAIVAAFAERDRRVLWGRGSFGDPFGAQSRPERSSRSFPIINLTGSTCTPFTRAAVASVSLNVRAFSDYFAAQLVHEDEGG
jgi:hypothetical protein